MNKNNLKNEIDKFYDSYQGASDLRSDEEKAKDYLQTEFVGAINPIEWVEKDPNAGNEWRSFPILNQFFTSKCVAFTVAKLALINFWLKTETFLQFSPNSIYFYRINKPAEGMIGNDAFDIWQSKGISLEAISRSNQIQEADSVTVSNFAKEVAKGFVLGSHITIPSGDFDRVASTIQTTGKGIMCWFFFTSAEWSTLYPKIRENLADPYGSRASRHSVTAVDCGLIDGEEYIRIEDSAHFGGLSVRYISRSFFTARNFLVKYPMEFIYESGELPTFVFTKNMKFGDKNEEVRQLQQYLQKGGYYPSNLGFDGIYGNITKASVVKFQLAHNLSPDGRVGPLTFAQLNLAV